MRGREGGRSGAQQGMGRPKPRKPKPAVASARRTPTRHSACRDTACTQTAGAGSDGQAAPSWAGVSRWHCWGGAAWPGWRTVSKKSCVCPYTCKKYSWASEPEAACGLLYAVVAARRPQTDRCPHSCASALHLLLSETHSALTRHGGTNQRLLPA